MGIINIHRILDEVRLLGCSDLHFTNAIAPVVRLNGTLRTMRSQYPEMDEEEILDIVNQMTNEAQQTQINNHIDTDFSFQTKSGYRHRVNVYFQKGKPAIAIRLLRNDIPTLEDLMLPPILADFAMRPRGLVLVTGPTGSGKSTTLAALVDKINREKSTHIITIEDPIEFTHKSQRSVIAQREVHYDTFSFAAALRSVLREDPDVVLIGEMRDLETIQAAITIAETGHLVFATLHTNSAAQSIDRMIDVFPAHQQPQVRTQLSNMLMAVCSQRLVPAIGGGRVVAAEIMVANSAIRSLIRDGKTHQLDNAIQTGADQGMQTMDRTLAKLVQTGVISYDSAREFAVDINELNRLVKG